MLWNIYSRNSPECPVMDHGDGPIRNHIAGSPVDYVDVTTDLVDCSGWSPSTGSTHVRMPARNSRNSFLNEARPWQRPDICTRLTPRPSTAW